jgi:hypothetical protein
MIATDRCIRSPHSCAPLPPFNISSNSSANLRAGSRRWRRERCRLHDDGWKGGRRDVCDAQGDEEVTIDESKCINSFQNHRLARLLLIFPPSFGLPPPPSPEPKIRAEAPQGASERQFNWQEIRERTTVPENGLQILVLMCKPFSAPLGPLKKVQKTQKSSKDSFKLQSLKESRTIVFL